MLWQITLHFISLEISCLTESAASWEASLRVGVFEFRSFHDHECSLQNVLPVLRITGWSGESHRTNPPQAHPAVSLKSNPDTSCFSSLFNSLAEIIHNQADNFRLQGGILNAELSHRPPKPLAPACIWNSIAIGVAFDVIIYLESYRYPPLTEYKVYALMALSQEQGFPLFLSTGMFFEG